MSEAEFINYIMHLRIVMDSVHIAFLIFSLFIQEFVRTFVAYYLGEHQAVLSGLYFVNPFRMIKRNLLTAFLVPVVGVLLGSYYATAWIISSRSIKGSDQGKYSRLRGTIIALIGPLMNCLIFLLLALLFEYVIKLGTDNRSLRPSLDLILDYIKLFQCASLSILLVHLLPLPPFECFNVLISLLPKRLSSLIFKMRNYPRLSLLISGLLLWQYLPPTVDYVEESLYLPVRRLARFLVLIKPN